MFYYKYKDKLMISNRSYEEYRNYNSLNNNISDYENKKEELYFHLGENPFKDFLPISEAEAQKYKGKIFAINVLSPRFSRRSFIITNEEQLFIKEENLNLLKKPIKYGNCKEHKGEEKNLLNHQWIVEAIEERRVISLNIAYHSWPEVIDYEEPKKWRINVVGLGDVGGILLTGLKLLGHERISHLGLYDRDENKIKRWKLELGQVLSPDMMERDINMVSLKEQEVFNCDMFVFCVSVGVPEVGKEGEDVRLVQFKGNSKILGSYAKMARESGFKGVFAVVSDPVDLLCKVAYEESNKNEMGNMDFEGLAPEQIRGYGLGVMNGRACYYAMENEETEMYPLEGRAFGPHGEGLIIANSIENYNEKLSEELTEKTKTANLEVRSAGFKPYIAPALSSGSLSLLSTINSQWHYSATFIGGTFMGCRNKLIDGCTELETLKLPQELFQRLQHTYELLDILYNR